MKPSQNFAQTSGNVPRQQPSQPSSGQSSQQPVGEVNWACTLQRDKNLSEVYVEGVTAGEEFQLQCQGPQVQWAQTPHLQVLEEDQFRLVLIQPTKVSSLDASLLVASYKIDEGAPLGPVYLTDGSSKVLLQGIQLKSMSVLPKDKEAKPFGPLGPLDYSWPLWIWITLGVFVCVMVGLVWRYLRRRNQLRALIKDLEKHRTALLPADQFSKDLRILKKSYLSSSSEKINQADSQKIISQIERYFLIFLSREFSIPAEIWSKSEILKSTLKQIHYSRAEAQKRMLKAMREIEKAKNHTSESTIEDIQQIMEIVRVAVQILSELHRRKR